MHRAWRHTTIRRASRRDRAGNARPYAHLRVLGFLQQAVARRIQRLESIGCLRNDVGESAALPVGFIRVLILVLLHLCVVTLAGFGHLNGHVGRKWHCAHNAHDQSMPA